MNEQDRTSPRELSHAAHRFAVERAHAIIASYRNLAYRLLVGHTGLLGALVIGAFGKGVQLEESARVSLAIVTALILGLFEWWLVICYLRCGRHVKRARLSWDVLGVKWNFDGSPPNSRIRDVATKTWGPVMVLPVILTAGVVGWLLNG